MKDSDYTILDKWISSKMNEFINKATEHYKGFEVYKLMKESSLILDQLSNWYVRRNRRRFWKSKNDNDKNAAYLTLYNCLMIYTKIMAPVIPFVTEKIYTNLTQGSNNKESIHLSSFPIYKKDYTDFKIIKEIDDVINIVNLARSARNKANIKIRQPLSLLYVFSLDDIEDSISRNSNQIKEELNIKSIKIINDLDRLLTYKIKPNFGLLSPKYGQKMKDIISFINQTDQNKLVSNFEKNKNRN